MSTNMLSISQAAKIIGVHPNSLRAWERQGLIKPVRLPSGQRRYSLNELNHILETGEGVKGIQPDTVAIYARVSTKKQAGAGNLDRQLERLRQHAKDQNYHITIECTDIASGLNQKRQGLTKIFKTAERGEIKKLIIEYPDRLARFGYSYIERHLKYCGVEIITIAKKEPPFPFGVGTRDSQTEMVQDLLSIVSSFSARLYGARGGKKVKQGFQRLITGANQDEQNR